MSVDSASASKSESPPLSNSLSDDCRSCSICGHAYHGWHFGIRTCRACAAFFRRTVVLKKTYRCRSNFDCEISKEMRNMCRFCRFKKCKQLGMKAEDVQLFRDPVGSKNSPGFRPPAPEKRSLQPADEASSPVNLPTPAPTPTVSTADPKNVDPNLQYSLENGSFLKKLREGYLNYQSSLKSLFTVMHPDTMFAQNVFKKVTHTEFVKMERGALSVLFDMLNEFWQPFDQLPHKAKIDVFRNFSLKFGLLIAVFTNAQIHPGIDQQTQWITHCNQYVDDGDLDHFFKDDGDPKESAKLFRKAIQIMKSTRNRVVKLKMDEIELVALGCVMLWNEFSHLYTEENEAVEAVKNQVYSELHNYLIEKHGISGTGQKMGAIMSIAMDLQAAEKEINEHVTICKLFNPHLIEVWDDL